MLHIEKRVLATVLLGALALGSACMVRGRGVYAVTVAPPPSRVVAVSPRPGYLWVDGHWEWLEGRWVWMDGYWVQERVDQVWVPGVWVHVDGGYRWRTGYWQRRTGVRVHDHGRR